MYGLLCFLEENSSLWSLVRGKRAWTYKNAHVLLKDFLKRFLFSTFQFAAVSSGTITLVLSLWTMSVPRHATFPFRKVIQLRCMSIAVTFSRRILDSRQQSHLIFKVHSGYSDEDICYRELKNLPNIASYNRNNHFHDVHSMLRVRLKCTHSRDEPVS